MKEGREEEYCRLAGPFTGPSPQQRFIEVPEEKEVREETHTDRNPTAVYIQENHLNICVQG